MREIVDWKKEERIPSFHFIPWILSGWSAGWSSTSCNVPTFIRFLASNVREETWSASIVRNERDFLRWNGWPSRSEPSDLRNNDLPYMLLCHRILLMEKEILVLKRVSNFRNSFCLIQCYSISLTWIYSTRTFLWIRLSKRVAGGFVKK